MLTLLEEYLYDIYSNNLNMFTIYVNTVLESTTGDWKLYFYRSIFNG